MRDSTEQLSSKKSWVILAVAILLAGGAAWLSSYYLDHRESEIKQALVGKKEVKVPVVVPKRSVMPGDLVGTNNMVVREIPKKYLPDGVFHPSQFESLIGRQIISSVSAGRPLLESNVAGTGIEQFSDLLEEGHRAITIKIDESNSNSGMLVPGDSIDLFLLADRDIIKGIESDDDSSALYLILENATVLATGKSTVESEEHTKTDFVFDQYSTITLGVRLKDAARIGLAKEDGKFLAMLRNRKDQKRVRENFIDASDVYADVSKKGGEKHVEFIIGGQSKGGVAGSSQQQVELEQLAKKAKAFSQLKVSGN